MDRFDPAVRLHIEKIEGLIEQKRDALERPNKTETETAFLRGYIKALRFIILDLTGDPDDESTFEED